MKTTAKQVLPRVLKPINSHITSCHVTSFSPYNSDAQSDFGDVFLLHHPTYHAPVVLESVPSAPNAAHLKATTPLYLLLMHLLISPTMATVAGWHYYAVSYTYSDGNPHQDPSNIFQLPRILTNSLLRIQHLTLLMVGPSGAPAS